MMTEWPLLPITDLFRLKQGTYLKKEEMVEVSDPENPFPVYGANGVIGYSRKKMYSERTTLVSCRGANCGVVHYTTKNSWISNNSIALVPRGDVDPTFYYYLAVGTSFDDVVTGSAQPQITITNLSSKAFVNPPLPTQRRIAGILSAYDDLIENNLRRIKTLEEMAQSLYREWFVQFRFPGHESARLIDSSLGKIPEGWDAGRLEDVLVLQRGFDLPKAEREDGDVPIYAASGITGHHSESKVKGPGIVTGRSGTIGHVLYVHEDFWPLNTALWVKAFPKSEPLYAYFVLSSIDLKGFNSGAAVPTLNRNDVHGLDTLIPPIGLQRRFQEIAGAMLSQSRTLTLSIQNLRRTRDLMLPRLLSAQ